MHEIAQILVIPVEEVFEGVNISFDHLLYNVEFFAGNFFGQGFSEFGIKLQIFW
jgi:hypothetical protein